MGSALYDSMVKLSGKSCRRSNACSLVPVLHWPFPDDVMQPFNTVNGLGVTTPDGSQQTHWQSVYMYSKKRHCVVTDTSHLPEAETFAAQEAKLNLFTVIADKHLKLHCIASFVLLGQTRLFPAIAKDAVTMTSD